MQDSLRWRLHTSLQWFGVLKDTVEHHVTQVIDQELPNTNPDTNPQTDAERESRTRPSAYLRRRCALCFGGEVVIDRSFLQVTLPIRAFKNLD